ncbi:helix-turn-helix domain-containing protein [Bartonella sp. HY038]|uniref:helix-turn-helix domain-containing protein n=1 Tax=Bartonella sp. HY038 TaxID=2759660 RepID=UPI0015FB2F43|nr:helix-turn-helix transcriptional regulator [Bartonella sp. HY038]
MSTLLNRIGDRLREARNKTGYTQAKIAAKLYIADRTYKFYELGRREIPISTALKFCEICAVAPEWLLLGNGVMDTINDVDIREKTIEALLDAMNAEITIKQKHIPAHQFAKQVSYIIRQSTEKNTSIEEEAKSLASIIIN